MRELEFADVVAIACSVLDLDPNDLLGVLDVDAAIETIVASNTAGMLANRASALLRGFVVRPALPNGNHRLAVLATSLFCAFNGCRLELDVDEARKHVDGIANGGTAARETVGWLAARILPEAEDRAASPAPARGDE